MARPVDFNEANTSWIGPGDTGALPALRTDGQENISRWELSAGEIAEILETGVVWLHVWGAHPPVYVSGESPFVKEPRNG